CRAVRRPAPAAPQWWGVSGRTGVIMRGLRFAHVCAVAGVLLIAPAPLWAQTQDAQALRQEIDQLRKELDALQKQNGNLLSALEAKLNAGEPGRQKPNGEGA